MSSQKNSLQQAEHFTNVPVVDIATEGVGIAKIDNVVYFIPHVIPGDIVDIEITKRKKNLVEAKAVRMVIPSSDRVLPHCEHFGVCGGCTLQHMSYQAQLRFKQKQVEDALTRIGKVKAHPLTPSQREGGSATQNAATILPIIGAKETEYYRNRLEFTFSNKRWLDPEELNDTTIAATGGFIGFHAAGIFYKVIDINKCYHQADPSNAMRLWIKQYALEHRLTFFDIMRQEGLLRNVHFRNTTTGEWMVTFVFYYEDPQVNLMLESFSQQFPGLTSIQYIINPKRNTTIYDLPVITFNGRDHIFEQMEHLRFKISAKSFYQTNSLQAYELYKVVRSFAAIKSNELVYDLYTGTGTIALFVASRAKEVIGIDHTEDAIEDAGENARLNNIYNAKFFSGDLKETLDDAFTAQHGMPDVVITDPPRAGMHPRLVKKLVEMAPPKMVYVSCNPSTQARDIAVLSEKYTVEQVQPVDMFPHTTHVENVALLRRRPL